MMVPKRKFFNFSNDNFAHGSSMVAGLTYNHTMVGLNPQGGGWQHCLKIVIHVLQLTHHNSCLIFDESIFQTLIMFKKTCWSLDYNIVLGHGLKQLWSADFLSSCFTTKFKSTGTHLSCFSYTDSSHILTCMYDFPISLLDSFHQIYFLLSACRYQMPQA